MADNSPTIDRLIARHGDARTSPARADWEQIFALPEDAPVILVNLLAFAQDAGDGLSGAAAYARYVQRVGGAFQAVGGQQLFFGPAHHSFGVDTKGGWDALIITRYPSAQALADMWLSPAFCAAQGDGTHGLARSQVVVVDGTHVRTP